MVILNTGIDQDFQMYFVSNTRDHLQAHTFHNKAATPVPVTPQVTPTPGKLSYLNLS